MAGTTVRGTFDLNVPARRKVVDLRRELGLTDRAAAKLGRTLDRVGGPVAQRRLAQTGKAIRRVGTDARAMERQVSTSFRASQRQVERSTRRMEADIAGLRREVRSLGRERATPHVNVTGVAKATAEVEALHRRINALGRERATARVGTSTSGGGLSMVSRDAQAAGRAMESASGSAKIFGSSLNSIAAGASIALPAINSLIGAAGSLAGVLGGAGLGAGAVGLAGGSALLTGIGGIASTAIPLTKRIQAASKAGTSLRTARASARTSGSAISSLNQQQSALDSVKSAQDALTQSQWQATQAQQDLTLARRDARRALVDLQFAEEKGILGQRRSRLDLTQARLALQAKMFDPTATPQDIQGAKIDLSEARLGVRESSVTRRRARTDFNVARRQGINRNPQVVQAEHAVQSSVRAEAAAARGLRQAYATVRQAQREVASGGSTIANARVELQRALKGAPQGTTQLISEARRFKVEWNNATRSAQGNLVSFARTSIATARKLTPTASRVASITTGAATREARHAEGFLTSASTQRFALTSARMFDENLAPVERSAEHIASTVMNVSRASRPFLREGTAFLDHWTKGWATSTSDITKTRTTVGGFVRDLKSGWRFGAASFRLIRDVLNISRPSGRGLLDTGTRFLDRLDRQVRRNPQKVRNFFKDTADSTVRMARGVGDIAHALFTVGQELQPVLKRFSDLIHLLSQAGLLGSPGGMAALFGGVQAARGRSLFARGGGAGGGAGTVVAMAAGGRGGGRAGGAMGRGGWVPVVMGQGPGGGRVPVAVRRGMGPGGGLLMGGATRRYGLGGLAQRAAPRARAAVGGAARAALPIMALFAASAGASAPGGLASGPGLMAALNSLSLGIVPGPNAGPPQGIGNAATQALIRSGAEGRPQTFNLPGFGQESLNFRGSTIDPRTGRTVRSPFAGMRRLPGFDRTGAFNAQRVSPATAQRTVLGLERQERPLLAQLSRARGGDRESILGQVAALRQLQSQYRATGQAAADRSRGHGASAATGFQAAFAVQRQGRGGLEGAVTRTNRNVIAKMRALGPEGKKALAASMLTWEKEQARRHPRLVAQYNELKRGIVGQLRGLGSDIRVINGQIFDGSQKQWNQIRAAINDPIAQAEAENRKHFTAIQQQAVNALRAMGFSGSQSRKIVSGIEKGGDQATAAQGLAKHGAKNLAPAGGPSSAQHKKARGGRIPGRGRQDNVSVADNTLAAPGELIVNRHSEARLNRRLAAGGQSTTVDAEVRGESRKHSHAPRQAPNGSPALRRYLAGHRISAHQHARGGRVRRFATGGRAGGWGHRGPGNSMPRAQMTSIGGQFGGGQVIHPMIAGQVRSLIAQRKMLVTAGWAPVGTHAGNSDHHWGGATDLVPGPGGSWDEVDRVAKWAEPSQGSPAHGFRWVGYDGDPGHGRGNHLHLSWTFGKLIQGLAGGRRGGGMVSSPAGRRAISLRPPVSGIPGVGGALSTRAAAIYASGLEQKVNARIGASKSRHGRGGALGPAGGGRTVGATTFGGPHDPGTGSTGYRGDNLYRHPDSYAELDMGRALGGLPYLHPLRVTGPKGSKVLRKRDIGLGGGPVGGAKRGIDLWFQAAQDLAGSDVWSGAVKVAELARGGRIPRYAGAFRQGGRFTTRPGRPVLFQAGEGGAKEHVDVTPASGPGSNRAGGDGGGGPRINVTVDMRGATITSKEHAQQIAEAAANRAAKKLLDALDRHGARDR